MAAASVPLGSTDAARGRAPTTAPGKYREVPTDAAGMDALFNLLTSAMERLTSLPYGSDVKIRKAEIDLLVHIETVRDCMFAVLKDHKDRARLQEMFAGLDCKKIARIRAICEYDDFSEMNANDQRISTCLNACHSVEEVLEDCGMGALLLKAQAEERQRVLDFMAFRKAAVEERERKKTRTPEEEEARELKAQEAALKSAEEAARKAAEEEEEAARKAAEEEKEPKEATKKEAIPSPPEVIVKAVSHAKQARAAQVSALALEAEHNYEGAISNYETCLKELDATLLGINEADKGYANLKARREEVLDHIFDLKSFDAAMETNADGTSAFARMRTKTLESLKRGRLHFGDGEKKSPMSTIWPFLQGTIEKTTQAIQEAVTNVHEKAKLKVSPIAQGLAKKSFRAGDCVEAHSLKAHPEWNGWQGKVVSVFPGGERIVVDFGDHGSKTLVPDNLRFADSRTRSTIDSEATPEQEGSVFKKGANVEIIGLKSHADWNGWCGNVVDGGGERVLVDFGAHGKKALLPANLQLHLRRTAATTTFS